jgi:hypothetical protein
MHPLVTHRLKMLRLHLILLSGTSSMNPRGVPVLLPPRSRIPLYPLPLRRRDYRLLPFLIPFGTHVWLDIL